MKTECSHVEEVRMDHNEQVSEYLCERCTRHRATYTAETLEAALDLMEIHR